MTPFGHYRFLRLPFGILSASEVFQKTLTEIFEGLAGVRINIDDILVWGVSKDEHNERLQAVLKRAQKAGLTFNLRKCVFGVKEIEFLRDVISEQGISPSRNLVESVRSLLTPTDRHSVRRMMGVVNYFRKYVPSLSDKIILLRGLVKENVTFEWTTAHQREWEAVCNALTNPPLLALFDKKDTKITAGASGTGLRAALLQKHGNDWRPGTYASRTLTDCETRYSQIEKETLGIVFACEKFHHFVYGRKVWIETDHRPLLAISQKGIGDMPPRLQRFFIRPLQYDYTLQFVPGKELVLADMLSRARMPSQSSSAFTDVDIHATEVVSGIVSTPMKVGLEKETRNDPYLSEVRERISRGDAVEGKLEPFAGELSVVEGTLLKGCKVVIPKAMRAEILRRVHDGHLGLNKCKARARRMVFWPGFSSAIDSFIRGCSTCQRYAYKQPSEPLLMQPTPDRPWHRVGIVFFSSGEPPMSLYTMPTPISLT